MDFINIRGISVPALGFGTYQLTGPDCVTAVVEAIETGYRHIDTAQIYGNETEIGEAIRSSGVPRGDIFLTTKIWMDRVSDGALQKSVSDSLARLKVEYVDLLLIHWPVEEVPFTQQMKALTEVQAAGKTKLIGVSNFTVDQMRATIEAINAPVAANQVEYHPYLSQKPVLDYVRAHDMFLTAYSPLARGKVADDPVLQRIGKQYGKSAGQITLRWLIQQDRVAAIPKASSLKNMRANFDIFDIRLTDAEMAEIAALARPDGRLINPEWSPQWDVAA